MKKIFTLMASIAIFLSTSLLAQDVLIVEPGEGTLNDAVNTHGGSKIYQLKAGEWYGLTAPINNSGYHLQIIGEEYSNETMPATLQTGTKADNTVMDLMINGQGDITIKNVYLMNADLAGQIGGVLLNEGLADARVVIDNCIIDPAGQTNPFSIFGGNNKFYFTNNQVLRHGHQIGANDGHLFVFDNAALVGVDSVVIENNTFVCTGMNLLSGNFANQQNNFIQLNHNTFLLHKSQLDWSVFENEYYLTNNLFFDFMTSAYMYTWQPMPGGDKELPKPALLYADTIPGETLPSTRIQYVHYNQFYRNPKHYTQIAEMNAKGQQDGKPLSNFHPLLWDGTTDAKMGADPAEAFAANREAHLFNHANNTNADFPLWTFGHVGYDVDPKFTDPKIYEMSDNLVEWQLPATLIHGFSYPATDFAPAAEWTKWYWDLDGDVSINDSWPVFNGVYTDEATLTGSIENLPLGDLNWFPEAKASWETHKNAIFNHIKSGNTGKYSLTSVESKMGKSSFRMYPNPAQNELIFDISAENEISILSIDGRCIKKIDNLVSKIDISDLNSGIYLVMVKEGNQVSTQKLIVKR